MNEGERRRLVFSADESGFLTHLNEFEEPPPDWQVIGFAVRNGEDIAGAVEAQVDRNDAEFQRLLGRCLYLLGVGNTHEWVRVTEQSSVYTIQPWKPKS